MIRLRWGLPLIEIAVPLPSSMWAIALWVIVLYRRDKFNEECVIIHERYHCWDQTGQFVFPWFFLRLVSFLRGKKGRSAYGEEGAYTAEEDCRKEQLGIID